MLGKMDSVIFVEGDKKYSGLVLGCEAEYFWLLVSELKIVYVGHPNRIYEQQGKKYFEVYDHAQATEKIFDSRGEVESYIFDYSKDPSEIIKRLKTCRLIDMA